MSRCPRPASGLVFPPSAADCRTDRPWGGDTPGCDGLARALPVGNTSEGCSSGRLSEAAICGGLLFSPGGRPSSPGSYAPRRGTTGRAWQHTAQLPAVKAETLPGASGRPGRCPGEHFRTVSLRPAERGGDLWRPARPSRRAPLKSGKLRPASGHDLPPVAAHCPTARG